MGFLSPKAAPPPPPLPPLPPPPPPVPQREAPPDPRIKEKREKTRRSELRRRGRAALNITGGSQLGAEQIERPVAGAGDKLGG